LQVNHSMPGRSSVSDSSPEACLVLMLKSPQRSKRRLRAALGEHAIAAAEHLCACALEDMQAWPGPVCYAAATPADRRWLQRRIGRRERLIEQCEGSLGQRINDINRRLLSAGELRQIFIGIDCPAVDPDYLHTARAALDTHDVVLGPAADGGVVLMGVRGPWPNLAALSWSTPALGSELAAACRAAALSIHRLETLSDVDSVDDLWGLRERLADDRRAARQALAHWLRELPAAAASR
jgi:glycosyltransferase A (GT-A) superfamily protein (DUF2064 family)